MSKRVIPVLLWVFVVVLAITIGRVVARRDRSSRTSNFAVAPSTPPNAAATTRPSVPLPTLPPPPVVMSTESVPTIAPTLAPAQTAVTSSSRGSRGPVAVTVPFTPGERLDYLAQWSRLDAARATLEVKAGSTPDTFDLVCTAETIGMARALANVSFALHATADSKSLLPRSVHRRVEQGGKVEEHAAQFDHVRGQLLVDDMTLPLDANAHDSLTALYAVRMMQLGPIGSTQTLSVTDLGNPIDLAVSVTGRAAGWVDVQLVSRPRVNDSGEALRIDARLEDHGARRIIQMRAALPFGEVILSLQE